MLYVSLDSNYSANADFVPTKGIVQDDQDELAQEIANQAKLYQNGVVTILAGGAASASDGFLHRGSRRYPRFALQVRLPDGHGRQIMIDTSLPHYILGSQWQHSPDPIDNRGWIFQEGTHWLKQIP